MERKRDNLHRRTLVDRKRLFILRYLQEHPCIDCTESDPVVLEFDHVDGKEYSISKLINKGFNIAVLEQELKRCVVRCANCHRRKTAKDFGSYKLSSVSELESRIVDSQLVLDTTRRDNVVTVLNADKVREIRIKYSGGEYSHRSLAAEYGVDKKTIGQIVRLQGWKWVF